MSNPAESATTDGKAKATPSVQERVNIAVKKLVSTSEGVYEFPSDVTIDEDIKVAAFSEKRRRDTQSALAKSRASQAAAEAENIELVKLVKASNPVSMTKAQIDTLNDLKFSDPEAWREEVNKIERASEKTLANTLSDISQKAKVAGSVGDREVILQDFLASNEGLVINQDIIDNDIPPRITNKLASGEVTFGEFLEEVRDYLSSGKVIATSKAPDEINLTKVGGGSSPTESAAVADSEDSYENETY